MDSQGSLPGRGRTTTREGRWTQRQALQHQRFSYHEGDSARLLGFASPAGSYDASESDITSSSVEQQQQQQQQPGQRRQQQQRQQHHVTWRHSYHEHQVHEGWRLDGATAPPSTGSYQYHSAQLDRFLREYRGLQEQLLRMREACDGLRQVNLRRDLDELRTAILELEARCDQPQQELSSSPEKARRQVAQLRRRYEAISAALAPKPILKARTASACLARSVSEERPDGSGQQAQVVALRRQQQQSRKAPSPTFRRPTSSSYSSNT